MLALETALARTQATREASANDHNADSLWTRADFARRAPGMDWSAFFDAAGLARQESFVRVAAHRGHRARRRWSRRSRSTTWKDYLRFHVVDDYADVLPRAFAEEARGAATGARPAAGDADSTAPSARSRRPRRP